VLDYDNVMKQILQNLSDGTTILVDAPSPQPKEGYLLVNTLTTLVSVGTERMLVDFGRASYLEKARQQPEKVKQVVAKVKTDGLITTLDAVRSKLAQPIPLGYSNVGVVSNIGNGVAGFKPGDRVVSNGPHAEVVNIPKNLCALIPDNVDDESAAFTVVASIGLQGVRLVQPTLGEYVVVIGVGLIGLLTIQLLLAYGCRVLAIDFEQSKLDLASKFGAEIYNSNYDPVGAGMSFSHGRGVDAVIITATTKSSDLISQAARMSRQRGRIVLVGVAGLELNRSDFCEKELSFQVSCSYGPGRYDPNYEDKGHDYPLGFVRWTEQRNFEAVLDLMSIGRLDVKPLITHRFAFEEAPKVYQLLTEDKSVLGILLQYTSDIAKRNVKQVSLRSDISFDVTKPIIGFIGAGNYASRILIPVLKSVAGQLHTIATAGGVSGAIHGKKAGFVEASTDIDVMLSNPNVNTVVIVTRHNTHADFVVKALNAGKHVFVEKPLAISIEELDKIESAYKAAQDRGSNLHLVVGFNRRFSPHIQRIKSLLQTVSEPKSFIMTINAGAIPAKHWTQDDAIGSGRIIGEACHFIDLMRFLAGADITDVQCCSMGNSSSVTITEDKATITISFADGSFGTIHYLANGASSFPKERIEVFVAGRVLQLDNFRKLKGFGWPSFKTMNLWKQNKGQNECVANFLHAIEYGKNTPIPIDEIFEVARVTIEASELLHK
jgi:predicted dehydrogenase/NADPH:quinone reductase-like Zn-dependent oxidoreductase